MDRTPRLNTLIASVMCILMASFLILPEPRAFATTSQNTSAEPNAQTNPLTAIDAPSAPTEQDAKTSDPTAPAKVEDLNGEAGEPQATVYEPITYELPLSVAINNGGSLQTADVTAKLMNQDVCLGEASNTTEGSLRLPALTFDAPGTYAYELQLAAKDRPGLSLAKTSLALEVTVKAHDGTLQVAALSCDGTPVTELTVHCLWNEPAGTWLLDAQGWHYLTYDGKRVANTTRDIDGKTYRFNSVGTMVTGWYQDGAVWHYYGGLGGDHDGALRTHDWLWNGAWYWFDDNGDMATGWRTIDGSRYFMDNAGHMLSGGWKWLGNGWYYLTSSGAAYSGWLWDGAWYYLDPAEKCAMATGWRVVDGARYVMDGSGRMLSGGWKWLGGAWYYLYPSGAAATGWQWIGGAWYYLGGPDDGAMKVGWNKVGDSWYYLTGSGAMATGWRWLGNAWYYLTGSGAMASDWQWIGGAWYYLGGPDDGAMKVGWIQDGNYWYYCYGSGAMARSAWIGSWWVNGSGAWDPTLPASGKIGWQNPSNYYQVSSYGVRFPGAGNGYYVTAPTIAADATRQQCINAFLARARNYLGTPYRWNYSDAPGVGVDCIGLVYQCAYATGMDLGDFNPYNHWVTGPYGWHSHDANNFWTYGKIQKISFDSRAPGDLIFWPGHVAIYIGNDQVIEAVPGRVRQASIRASGTNYLGVGRLYI